MVMSFLITMYVLHWTLDSFRVILYLNDFKTNKNFNYLDFNLYKLWFQKYF